MTYSAFSTKKQKKSSSASIKKQSLVFASFVVPVCNADIKKERKKRPDHTKTFSFFLSFFQLKTTEAAYCFRSFFAVRKKENPFFISR
jgi:hypothetical protein